MRLIIIENEAFRVSEKEYQKILAIEEESKNLPFGADMFIDEYLEVNKSNYKNLGTVDFDFRL